MNAVLIGKFKDKYNAYRTDLLYEYRGKTYLITAYNNGYYHLYLLEKDIFEGNILRDYRISRDGKMTETNKFYRVSTKEDFYKWCIDRNVNFDLEKCSK